MGESRNRRTRTKKKESLRSQSSPQTDWNIRSFFFVVVGNLKKERKKEKKPATAGAPHFYGSPRNVEAKKKKKEHFI